MYQLFTFLIVWLTSLAWQENISNLGKDQNPKSEVWFLLNVHHFCMFVKLKKILSHNTVNGCLLYSNFYIYSCGHLDSSNMKLLQIIQLWKCFYKSFGCIYMYAFLLGIYLGMKLFRTYIYSSSIITAKQFFKIVISIYVPTGSV